LTKTLEKDKVSDRKDLMIYLLTELSKKGKPVRMDEFFFETGYANGLDSFREVLEEMSRLEWINIIDKPGTPAFGVLPTRDIKYTISIKGIEHLSVINNPLEKKKEKKNYHIKEIIIGLIITVVGGIILNIIPNPKEIFQKENKKSAYQKPYIGVENYKLKAINDSARNLDTISVNFKYQGSKIQLNRNFELVEYNFNDKYYFHLGNKDEFEPKMELIEVILNNPIIDSINQNSEVKLELKRHLIFSGFRTAYFEENDKEKIGNLKISFSYESEIGITNDTLVSDIYIVK
jgi:hypothetical protein